MFGDDYLINIWTTDNGLPQNIVNDIIQTEDGYIWIATNAGFSRFDGHQFENINSGNTPGIVGDRILRFFYYGGNRILCIEESGKWILMENGAFRSFHSDSSLKSYCWKLKYGNIPEDKNKILLLTTRDMRFIDIPSDRSIKFKGSVPCGIFQYYETADKTIWMRSDNGKLYTIKEENGKTHYKEFRQKLDAAYILSDFKDVIWFGEVIHNKIYLKNNEGKMLFKDRAAPIFIHYTLGRDNDSNIWLPNFRNGLLRINNKGVTNFTMNDGLSDNTVKKIFIDKYDNIWLGMDVGGLNRIQKRKIKTYSYKEGLNFNLILSIHEDKDGAIYVGTNGAGIFKGINGKFRNISSFFNLKTYPIPIWSVFDDSENNLWFGQWGEGLIKYNGKKIKRYTVSDGLISKYIKVLFEDSKKNLWIGTESGISILSNGTFSNFSTNNGLANNNILTIFEDRKKRIWIGTYGDGISCYENNKFTNYSIKDGLSNEYVRAIHEDSKGALWIGTYGGGLNRYLDGQFKCIKTDNGLFDNVVHNIIDDNKGNYWFSCNRGIFYVKKQSLDDFCDGKINSVKSVVFRKTEGMINDECNSGFQPSAWKTKDNKILYPTLGGVAVVDLNEIKPDTIPPVISINKIIVGNKQIQISNNFEIPPGENHMEITFTTLNFTSSENNLFKYKVTGLFDDWIDLGNRRTAYFTKMPPGHYKFTVIGCNNEGIWNNEGASIEFSVNPFFYQTWWFQLFLVIAVMIIIYSIWLVRIKTLQKREKELEILVAIRTSQLQESNETKDKLFSIIAHDLRGPIGNFKSTLEVLTTDLFHTSDQDKNEFLRFMRVDADHLYNLLENLLNWSRGERDLIDLKPNYYLISDFINENIALFLNMAKSKNITISYNDQNNTLAFFDPDTINTVLRNLISNAIKFTKENGEVSVSTEFENKYVKIIIKDTGTGIDKEKLDKLFKFKKSFSTKGTKGEKGTGLGLILCKEFITKNNGKIWVESETGKGSKFIFTLPLKES